MSFNPTTALCLCLNMLGRVRTLNAQRLQAQLPATCAGEVPAEPGHKRGAQGGAEGLPAPRRAQWEQLVVSKWRFLSHSTRLDRGRAF